MVDASRLSSRYGHSHHGMAVQHKAVHVVSIMGAMPLLVLVAKTTPTHQRRPIRWQSQAHLNAAGDGLAARQQRVSELLLSSLRQLLCVILLSEPVGGCEEQHTTHKQSLCQQHKKHNTNHAHKTKRAKHQTRRCAGFYWWQ